MAGQADMTTWKRLGQLLEQQRVQLDTRYANMTLFAAERGVDYRLCWDAEHGARDNYRRATLAALEIAYGLEPRSIEAFLTGQQGALVTFNPYADDADLAKVWDATRGLSLAERHNMVNIAKDLRSGGGNGGRKVQPRRKRA
jgi:hypothetical protein